MLNGEVPLIVDGRLHVLIPEAEDLPVKAGEVRAGRSRRSRLDDAVGSSTSRQRQQLVLGLEFAGRRAAIEWRVDRQTQVGAGAFEVIGNGEGAANHGVTVEAAGRPSESDARLEGLAAVHAAVERLAGTAYTG